MIHCSELLICIFFYFVNLYFLGALTTLIVIVMMAVGRLGTDNVVRSENCWLARPREKPIQWIHLTSTARMYSVL